jgi:hypothetical protein
MSIETVLAKIVVKPKDSVINLERVNINTIFYNISNGKTENGQCSYPKKICSWFEELDSEHYILLDDTMYIEFLNDVSNVKDGYLETCELFAEDYSYCGISKDYPTVWNSIKDEFEEFLKNRKYTEASINYLINIRITSTYCSYVGDGDVYLNIDSLFKVESGKFNKIIINTKEEELWNL